MYIVYIFRVCTVVLFAVVFVFFANLFASTVGISALYVDYVDMLCLYRLSWFSQR